METSLAFQENDPYKHLSGWSRHIDPGLVQEDGLGYISISLPATLWLFCENLTCALQLHTPAATWSSRSHLGCSDQN